MPPTMLYDPIELSDSENDDIAFASSAFTRESTIDNTPEPINVDADDDDDDADDGLEIVPGGKWLELQKQKATAQQSLNIPHGHQQITHYDAFGTHRIKPGMNVPLVGGGFLRIKYLTQDKQTEEVSVHGLLLKPARQMSRQLKRDTGELALTIWAEEGDERPDLIRGLEEHSIYEINFFAEKLSREIIFTNKAFPALREWTKRDYNSTDEHWAKGRLVCRVKNIKLYSTKGRGVPKVVQEAWVRFREEEADPEYGVSDFSKTLAWRGDRDASTSLETNSRTGSRSESVISTATQTRTKQSRISNENGVVDVEKSEYHEITVTETTTQSGTISIRKDAPVTLKAADICCGAGGVSGGMQEAGFQIKVGVDKCHAAAETFRSNFPGPTTKTYEMDVNDFLTTTREAKCCPYCHVVHFSLPCPFFSPAHTRKGVNANDQENLNTNMIVEEALKALRPMYATFENTSGLKEISKHREYYDLLIRSLTDLGWNAVFKIAKLSDYGNPQRRRRLIIIASCPGMPLIKFPKPTHGIEHGLRPLMTVGEAIANIDPRDPLHNSKELRQRLRGKTCKLAPAEMNEPLRELISTGGPRALHPNGMRRFTFREGMRLMRFRDDHKLAAAARTAGDKWKLIGNAVPRDLIRLIYKDIYKVLQKWFADCYAPILLDEGMDVDEEKLAAAPTESAQRPTLKRKRTTAEEAMTEVDLNERVVPQTPPARRFGRNPLVKQQQQSLSDLLRPEKKRATDVEPANKKIKRSGVVDLTED